MFAVAGCVALAARRRVVLSGRTSAPSRAADERASHAHGQPDGGTRAHDVIRRLVSRTVGVDDQ
ncbi:hypothetical protein A7U58_23270 [Burkholderia pseudomallei]|nr:hypothetical protein A7U58_23270 [Burkholderia pseudomallei]